jgi:8-oxo-dGTP pyrophosphatase MutT (NUDIX family)
MGGGGGIRTAYPENVELPIRLRRLAYRCAYGVLWVYRSVAKPALHGVKCVLVDSDRILLVQHTYGRRQWDFPGGGLKRNESPLSAARRETKEELGVDIDHWLAIGDVLSRFQRTNSTMHCFRAELHDPQLTLDHGELLAARWFALDELPPNLAGHVAPILAHAGFGEPSH